MIPRFRVWDKDNLKMCKVIEINFYIGSVEVESDNRTDFYNPILFKDEYIFMQSTGLTDKNGVEIFEGDIVKATYNTINEERTKIEVVDVIGEVYKNYGAYYIDGYLFLHLNNFEIIGNIYEHEHLLKGE